MASSRLSFLTKAGGSLALIFIAAHFTLDAAVSLSAPSVIPIGLSIFLLFCYLLLGGAALVYFLGLLKLATKEVVEHGLDKDSREAIAICVGMTLLAIVVVKLLG